MCSRANCAKWVYQRVKYNSNVRRATSFEPLVVYCVGIEEVCLSCNMCKSAT